VKSSSFLIGPLLQGFFAKHLIQHKHVSPETVASYRDAFRLLLQYVHKQLKTEQNQPCLRSPHWMHR
jgi:hypothetical protein